MYFSKDSITCRLSIVKRSQMLYCSNSADSKVHSWYKEITSGAVIGFSKRCSSNRLWTVMWSMTYIKLSLQWYTKVIRHSCNSPLENYAEWSTSTPSWLDAPLQTFRWALLANIYYDVVLCLWRGTLLCRHTFTYPDRSLFDSDLIFH